MEIERKFLIPNLPENLEEYPHYRIEQGYLTTRPVLRIRMAKKPVFSDAQKEWNQRAEQLLPSDVKLSQDTYSFVYKSSGLLAHEEVTLPLSEEAYLQLKAKCEGKAIEKVRYLLPLEGEADLKVELDLFLNVSGPDGKPLQMAEVEFPSEEAAKAFVPPAWFGEDVTMERRYHNSEMIYQN